MAWGSRQGPASFDPGPRLRALAELLDRPRGVLEAIGGFIVKESGKAFREQRLGNFPWKPRVNPNWPALLRDAESGAARPPQRRFQERPALMDTGLLARSIAHQVVSNTDVEVGVAGVAKAYADIHQVGGKSQSVVVTKAIQHRLWGWIKGSDGSARGIRSRKIAKAKAGAIAGDGVLRNLKAELTHAKKKANVEAKRSGGRNRKYDGFVADLKQRIVERKAKLRGDASASVPKDEKIAWGSKESRARAAAGLASLRWLLNPRLRGSRIPIKIQARPFIGLPGTLVEEIERTIGVSVRQVR